MSLKGGCLNIYAAEPAPQLNYAAGLAPSKRTSVPHVAEAHLTKILQEENGYNRYPETNTRASQRGVRMVKPPARTQQDATVICHAGRRDALD